MVGSGNKDITKEDPPDEDFDVSDDDSMEEEEEGPWFNMGLTEMKNLLMGNYGVVLS